VVALAGGQRPDDRQVLELLGDGRQVLGVRRRDDAGRHGRAITFQWDESNAGIRVALGDTFGEDRHPGSRRDRQ